MPLFADLTGGSLFLVIVVVVTAFVLMLRTQRQLRQPKKSSAPSLPSTARIDKSACRPGAPEMKVQRQVEHWEVRMHDLARELSAQLDSKMSVLEHLIRDAERQIARLDERLGRKPEGASEPATTPARPAPISAPHITTQAAALASSQLIGQGARQASPRATKERRFDEVYALADAGHAPAAIASRVGSPVGEIELILSLRKRG
jgi:hypothetical protein